MNRIETLIAEADFHIHGMSAIIGALVHGYPRTDPEIMRTLSYSLMAMKERRDVLGEVNRLPFDLSA